ncbi:hypothetical protein SLE2022_128730 [Rubroshorea leprosula]
MTKDLLVSTSRFWVIEKQHQSSWSNPPQSILKVNVDASFSPNLWSATLAMVGCDSNSEICFGNNWFCMALSPLIAEAIALLKAVQFVANMGVHYVIFESDN